MIAVADYGAGNLFSVKNACDFLSIETKITRDPALIREAEGIILPGVGAFPDAMQRLKETGLIPVLQAEAQKSRCSASVWGCRCSLTIRPNSAAPRDLPDPRPCRPDSLSRPETAAYRME